MFRVALLQLISEGTQRRNMEKGVKYAKAAKEMGADIALFPEMWNNGYSSDVSAWETDAIERDGEFFRTFQNLARDLNMAIGVTYLEKYDPLPRNTVTVVDRFGNCALTYAKVHTCDFDIERNLTPGDDFYVADLDTVNGNVKIGAMICYDREFPESARILMLKGAEVILVPNACPMEINRLAQLRARAFENMLGIATANYAFGQHDCNGHSSAFDGIANGQTCPGVNGWRDTLIVEAGEAEGIYLADFPMEKIREYRGREIHGNAYRRPAKYHLLVEDKIDEPFVRDGYRK
ncbi:MAG: carbon-nitrogen hydrolase family protein [Defluviitaleaceae bacterium]|nr:carbon-nitrogen hydrolase family protein [Defluviitaleaceae bacterium]